MEAKGVRDGHYFQRILEEESSRLLANAERVDAEIRSRHMSEETIGILRVASGKAKLLVSKKMEQFRGLCATNINQSGEALPVSNDDLEGFWDMIMLQVYQVDSLFEDIAKLRNNNWRKDTGKKLDKFQGASSSRKGKLNKKSSK